ncbi:B12-binding domain-containing radical SAM protein [Candidatus Woesearchaeota archaeon]|nr:B12-binding domain-containing radical SAM protein [Candidatus Woesearchaeota archaeon]
MRILFVNAARKKHMFALAPPLALATLAAHTPQNYTIEIVDEYVSSLKFKDFDLVAISCTTDAAVRGYEIAKKYREKGAKVVMGGVHVSMLPNEAINYCDSVVIGEAESVWKIVLNDFENNSLKKFYYGKRLPMVNMPIPRRDLFKKRYVMQNVETARGCPFRCEFCSVSAFSGETYRQRPVKEVIDEIETIKQRNILFVDDNILGVGKDNEERAIKLCNELKPLNKRLFAQTSINVADNDEVLKAFSDAGMKVLFVGIESLNKKNLEQMGKGINLGRIKDYKRIIRKIHDHGMCVLGSFIFGNDYDTKKTFKDIIEFINAADLDANLFHFLLPLPGTRLYGRLFKENRILYTNYPDDWKKYREVVFKPKNMTSEELELNTYDALKQTTSLGFSFNKFLKSMSITKSLSVSTGIFIYNYIKSGW